MRGSTWPPSASAGCFPDFRDFPAFGEGLSAAARVATLLSNTASSQREKQLLKNKDNQLKPEPAAEAAEMRPPGSANSLSRSDLASDQARETDRSILNSFFERLGRAPHPVLLLDYDGTLAPFRLQRDEAVPYPGVIPILNEIQRSGRTRVVVISGRAIDDLIPLLGLAETPEIWGSHGWERRHSDGRREIFPMEPRLLAAMDAGGKAAEHVGHALERKPGCLAIHWRGSSPDTIQELKETIGRAWARLAEEQSLELKNFDGGLELRLPGRHKGCVVKDILDDLEDPASVIAFLGDDLTDEDAFAALEGHGLRVLVRSEARDTRADCRITPPEELLTFLTRWRDLTSAASPRPATNQGNAR